MDDGHTTDEGGYSTVPAIRHSRTTCYFKCAAPAQAPTTTRIYYKSQKNTGFQKPGSFCSTNSVQETQGCRAGLRNFPRPVFRLISTLPDIFRNSTTHWTVCVKLSRLFRILRIHLIRTSQQMTQQCLPFPAADKHRLELISHNSTNKNNAIFVVYLPRLHQLKLYSVECSGDLWVGQLMEAVEDLLKILSGNTYRESFPGIK